jgi:hypothetical protein
VPGLNCGESENVVDPNIKNTMNRLALDPYIPLALWFPLALAAAGLLAVYAVAVRRRLPRRRAAVIALMALALAVPLVMLLNPTWLERVPPPAGKPLLTILIDRSASMATPDEAGAPRFAAACRTAVEASRQLADRYDVRVRTFAADSAEVAADQLANQTPDGAATDLAGAVEDALVEERPQGQAILLLSDGGHNAGGGSARVLESIGKAKAMAAPLYAKTFGAQTEVSDLAVELDTPQELAFAGQKVPVLVRLQQRGALGRKTSVSLVQAGKTVENRSVDLKADGVTETIFYTTQAAPGLYRYEVKADPLPHEVTELNNTATLLLRVVDQPVRVLLLEGKPYWDTKFLVRTLSEDPSIQLDSIVQLAEGRLLERKIGTSEKAAGETASVPAGATGFASAGVPRASPVPAPRSDQWKIRADAGQVLADPDVLASHQIVILGRDAEVFLNDESVTRLRKWLAESEGSLVCFRGSPASQLSQRLGELMPVHWAPSPESRFRAQWTPAGQALRWLPSQGGDALAVLPSLSTVSRAERPAPLAVVLATAAGRQGAQEPVLSYQPVGSGRVVVVEGAGMWRWAFLAPQYQQHDDQYSMLWRSLVRWLVANVGLLPNQQLALRTDKVIFSTSEVTTATLLLRKQPAEGRVPQIELSGGALTQPRSVAALPSGTDPGQFRVVFGKLPEGRYTARVAGARDAAASVAFDVRGNLAERLDVRAEPALMKLIAETSGGAVLDDPDPRTLAEHFDRHLVQTRPERIVRAMAWDRWWMLAVALGIWGSAWALRRWSGLV